MEDLAAAVTAPAADASLRLVFEHTYGQYAEVLVGLATTEEMDAAARAEGRFTAAERHEQAKAAAEALIQQQQSQAAAATQANMQAT